MPTGSGTTLITPSETRREVSHIHPALGTDGVMVSSPLSVIPPLPVNTFMTALSTMGYASMRLVMAITGSVSLIAPLTLKASDSVLAAVERVRTRRIAPALIVSVPSTVRAPNTREEPLPEPSVPFLFTATLQTMPEPSSVPPSRTVIVPVVTGDFLLFTSTEPA